MTFGKGTEGVVTTRQRIWQAMRILRVFSATDLMGVAEAERTNVYTMLKRLQKAGVIERCGKRQRRIEANYRLIRDLGVNVPEFRYNGSIYDSNSRKFLKETESKHAKKQ